VGEQQEGVSTARNRKTKEAENEEANKRKTFVSYVQSRAASSIRRTDIG
jgi:hypothetical protein